MAKRFTDSGKWGRKNFRLLPPKMKLAWFYVTDNCDNTGIWHPDFDLMSFQVGMEISEEEFVKQFGHKLVRLDSGALFFPSFVEFQYGELNPTVNAHKPVLAALKKHGVELFKNPSATLPKEVEESSGTPKDKNKNKDQHQDKDPNTDPEKEGSAEGNKKTPPPTKSETEGPVPELAEVACAAECLADISHVAQRIWIAAYGFQVVCEQLPLAFAKWASDDLRKAQGGLSRYLAIWFQNRVEKIRERGSGTSTGAGPPAVDLVWVRTADLIGPELAQHEPPFTYYTQEAYARWQKAWEEGRGPLPPPMISIGSKPPKAPDLKLVKTKNERKAENVHAN